VNPTIGFLAATLVWLDLKMFGEEMAKKWLKKYIFTIT
jgi:hypothetical protein